MADRVIISGISRKGERVDFSELKQMEGRAGRKQGGDDCYCHYVMSVDEYEEFENDYYSDNQLEVFSQMNEEELCFHILPDIVNGSIKSSSDIRNWYERSLHYKQFGNITPQWIIKNLKRSGAIIFEDSVITPTELAKISVRFYLHPQVVYCLAENFNEVFEYEKEDDDYQIAYALSDVPKIDYSMYSESFFNYLDNYPTNFNYNYGKRTTGALISLAMSSDDKVSGSSSILALIRKDFGRYINALRMLNDFFDWGRSYFFEDLEMRVLSGVSKDLLNLIRIEGIGKSFAKELKDLGIMNLDDIIEKSDYVLNNVSGHLKKRIQTIIKENT